jgi:N utilization substance protein A
VRLASKLIGWDIDIKSEEEKRREIEAEMTRLTAPTTPLTVLAGVGPKTIEKMEAAGITNLEQLAAMTPEQLMEIPGIGEKMVDKIYQAVNRFYESGETGAAAAAEASAAETTAEVTEEAAEGAEPRETAEAAEASETAESSNVEGGAEANPEVNGKESTAETHSAAAESAEEHPTEEQQKEKSS